MSLIITSKKIDAKPRSKYRRSTGIVDGDSSFSFSPGSSAGTVIESSLEIASGEAIVVEKNTLGKMVYTISHGETSSAESTENEGVSLISNISLDKFGHITEVNSSDVTESLDKRYLRKDVDDTAAGIISFEKEIKSSVFLDGMDGKGWQITSVGAAMLDSARVRADIYLGGIIGSESFASGFTGWGIEMNVPDCSITTDFLTVRKSMKVYELVYSQIYGLGGSVMITDLNKILSVENKGDYFSVVIDKMEDSMRMNLRKGDIVRMQKSLGVNIRYFYGEILSVTPDAFDMKIIEGEDVPEPGDVVFRMGNKTDDSRQGVIYLTSSDDKAPYIDVLDGITDASMFEKIKVRMGNISGIRTKGGKQLKGYGIYAEGGVFDNSTIFLESGDTIEQYFSIMEGKFDSKIEALRNDISSAEGNILRNSSFANDTYYWVTNDNISIINVGGSLLWFNANFYADKRSVTDIYRDGNKNVLRILGAKIYQPEANYNLKEGAEEGTYSFTLFYKVRRAGTLKVGIPGTELYEEMALPVSNTYERLVKVGEWDMTGDFEISFTGEVLVYGVSLFEDTLAGTIAKMWTQIYQNEEQIALRATKQYVDAETGRIEREWSSELSVKADQIEANVKQWTNGQLTNYSTISQTSNQISTVVRQINQVDSRVDSVNGRLDQTVSYINSAGWITTPQGNALWAKKEMEDGNTIVSTINQTADEIKIRADRITLEGTVTANNTFKIHPSGSMEATGGKIGGFTITGATIFSDSMIIEGNGISFASGRIFAGFGTASGPSVLGLPVPVWVQNTAGEHDDQCYGMYVSAKGAPREGNHALYIGDGFISGFAIKPRHVTSTTTLNHEDAYVSCYNTIGINVYLPSRPEPGKLVFIRKMNNAGVTVSGNGKSIHNSQGEHVTSLSFGSDGDTGMFFYDGQYWCYSKLLRN